MIRDCFASLAMTFVVLVATTNISMADPVTFDATINSPQISLDEVLQLTLTFSGINQDLDPVSLPVVDGFTAKYIGPSSSTSMEIINGNTQTHSTRSFIYNLFPLKVGHFQIPPISATINGQTYTTKPIDVEVVQSTSQASNSDDQNQAPSDQSINDKVKLIAWIDQRNVYLNQQVPLTVRLLYRDVPLRDVQYPAFDKTGMNADDFDKPVQGTMTINGVQYNGVEFKTNIYPTHLGDLTVGPVQIQGNVLYKTQQNNPFGDNNPFNADIFNSFFDSYATRPVTISSQPIQLHVSMLPDENKPADFSGALGQYDFQASVAPAKVKLGDPLTLKMDIKGSGNFKNLKMPEFRATGFKSYQPQIKNTGDEKTLEEVIIPVSSSITQVPALNFSYFDTASGNYKTITQGPFPIEVTPPSPDQDFKAIGFADMTNPQAIAANQFSWGRVFNKLGLLFKKLTASIWFWISLIVILIAGVSYILWKGFQERLENDPAFARRLKAVREARQALKSAEGYIAGGQVKDFYALLTKVLHDYLANKWHESSAALSTQEILNHLKAANVDETHISKAKNILEQADLVCFAGAQRSSADMRTDLSGVGELIAYFEKVLK